MVQQYRGSTVDIGYSPASLREIFANNIRREKERNLVDPSKVKKDPIAGFFGMPYLTHSYTREREDVFEYIYRHTLRRPRDFMTIGQKLSDLRPAERRLRERFQEIIGHGATEIATEYLNEIAPYLGEVDMAAVLARIPSNVLTREAVEDIFLEHNADVGPAEEMAHIFCMLFRAGLLGHIDTDHLTGKRVQRFLPTGQGIFQPDGILPPSTHYLVHPVLAGVIARLNPQYAQRIDRVNIIGHGRPWRDATDRQLKTLMVLRADVDGFGQLMQRGLDHGVRDALRRAVDAFAADCLHASVGSGDSLMLVDDRILVLVKAARRIMEEVSEAAGSPRLRVAIAVGPVDVRERGDDPPAIEGGTAVLVASRIEPLVRPGEIWVTDDIRLMLDGTDTLYRAEPVAHPMARADGHVNVKKHASDEEDMWVKLHRIVS
jgi:class 3 adenylate cyclase